MADDAGVLRISKTIAAKRDDVFAAWTQPEHLVRWWGPGPFRTVVAEVDLRPGGAYRLVIEGPDAPRMELRGEYREVDAPARLVYTWRWVEGWPDPSEMLVTVEFHERGAQTDVVLTQTGFEGAGGSAPYRGGWESGLEKLAAYAAKER